MSLFEKIEAALPIKSIFSKGVQLVDQVDDLMTFNNGEAADEAELGNHPDAKHVHSAVVEWLKNKIDLPFVDGTTEDLIEDGFILLASGISKKLLGKLAKNETP